MFSKNDWVIVVLVVLDFGAWSEFRFVNTVWKTQLQTKFDNLNLSMLDSWCVIPTSNRWKLQTFNLVTLSVQFWDYHATCNDKVSLIFNNRRRWKGLSKKIQINPFINTYVEVIVWGWSIFKVREYSWFLH